MLVALSLLVVCVAVFEDDPLDQPHQVINALIAGNKKLDKGQISDGYHTFDELYAHRCQLFILVARSKADYVQVWRSKKHADGSSYDGWFILGIGKQAGKQITYHLPESMWNECAFAETRELAPEFDGHTSADVLERLKEI